MKKWNIVLSYQSVLKTVNRESVEWSMFHISVISHDDRPILCYVSDSLASICKSLPVIVEHNSSLSDALSSSDPGDLL